MSGINFTVANKANPEQTKSVKVNKNLEITNYTGNSMPPNGLNVKVVDGKTTIVATTSDNKQTSNLRSADIASYKYTVFENLMKLDKNPDDLSEQDLKLATKSMEGVKQVRRDEQAGVTTIVFDNGEILKFDFETNKEKAERVKTEKEQAPTPKVENKKDLQTIDTRSTLEKGLSAIANMFIN